MNTQGVGSGLQGSLLQLIAEAETFEDALRATLHVACESAGWEYGEAWLPDDDAYAPGPTYDPAGRFGAFRDASADVAFDPGEGLVGRVAATGGVEWLDEPAACETFVRATAAGEAGFDSAVGIPVVDEADRVVAVLAFFTTHQRPTDDAFAEAVAGAVEALSGLFRRKRARDDEAAERALLDDLLQASPVGLLVVGRDGDIERANPAAAGILGTDVADLIGSRIDTDRWRVRDEAGDPLPLEAYPFARVLRTGEAVLDRRLVVERADGTDVTVSVNAVPVSDDDEPDRAVVAFNDVSERAEYERALEEKNRQLESFASVLSHDIRNPLAVATGFLELARETGDDSYLDRVERSHERIEELIDTLLVLARKGRMISSLEPVDIAAAAREAWANTATEEATLEVGDVGVVEADPVRLKQVFENLFRNSIQHAGPDVRVGVVPLSGGGFAVEDDGPGIPESRREEMLAPGHESSGGGFGLGLSIVAAVAEGHEWDLHLTESEAGGARFEFRPGGE